MIEISAAFLILVLSVTFGHFDVLRSSRWHSLRMEMTGSVELVGIHIAWSPDGET